MYECNILMYIHTTESFIIYSIINNFQEVVQIGWNVWLFLGIGVWYNQFKYIRIYNQPSLTK